MTSDRNAHRRTTAPSFHPQPDFWRGKRVLVTGHTGFKGSWLSLWLWSLGAEVMGYALPPETKPAMFDRLQLHNHVRHVEGNLLDLSAFAAAAESFQPEIVFHLAAQPLVRRSYEDPVGTFNSNVQGTVHAAEVCRRVGSIRSAVFVTTDKCYENQEWIWAYRENDRLGGHDPYSCSKACAELVVAAYHQSFFAADDACRIATARAGNVIGGGDWSSDRLIPDTVRAIAAQQPLVLRNPRYTRPWQHVVEALLGYLMLARAIHERHADCPQAVNFGPSPTQVASVQDVANMFADAYDDEQSGRSLDIELRGEMPDTNAFAESSRLSLDSSLAMHSLGWEPRVPLAEAVQHTAAWYRHEHAGRSAEQLIALTLDQISQLTSAGT